MDAPLSLCTRKYLEACNKLFERGLLCHSKIKDESSQVLMNIEEGYAFFSKWIASLMKEGEFSCYYYLKTSLLQMEHLTPVTLSKRNFSHGRVCKLCL